MIIILQLLTLSIFIFRFIFTKNLHIYFLCNYTLFKLSFQFRSTEQYQNNIENFIKAINFSCVFKQIDLKFLFFVCGVGFSCYRYISYYNITITKKEPTEFIFSQPTLFPYFLFYTNLIALFKYFSCFEFISPFSFF